MLKLAYNNSSSSMPLDSEATVTSLSELFESDSSRLDAFAASTSALPAASSGAQTFGMLHNSNSSLYSPRQQKQRRRSLGMKSPGRKRAEYRVCREGLSFKDTPLQVPHRYTSPAPRRIQAPQHQLSSRESKKHAQLLLKDSCHSHSSWAPPMDPTAKTSAAKQSLNVLPPPTQTNKESPCFKQSSNDPSSPTKPLRKPSPNKRSGSKRSLSVPPPPPSNEISPRFQQAPNDPKIPVKPLRKPSPNKRSASKRSLSVPPPPPSNEESPRFQQARNDSKCPVKPQRHPSPMKAPTYAFCPSTQSPVKPQRYKSPAKKRSVRDLRRWTMN